MGKETFVGEGINAPNASWTFGENTAANFEEHVKKSVPLYEFGHDLIVQISDYFIKPDSIGYELGVSVGSLLKKLTSHHKKTVQWVGIDIEPKMIEQARLGINNKDDFNNVKFVAEDINLYPYEPCDLIVSNYTIQFVPPRLRQDLLCKIYSTLNWGGAFLFFEKVRGPDARFQDILTGLYTDYKLNQGYSPDEIIAKSKSLKGVLEPFSTQGNLELLKRAGFMDIMTVFKYICFEGFLCIK